jgi:serine protease AprX
MDAFEESGAMSISIAGGASRTIRVLVVFTMVALLVGLIAGVPAEGTVGGDVDVVVTAGDGSVATAAAAVESVGGTVTSEFGLIGGVGAVVPSSALQALTADASLRSVTRDRTLSPMGYSGYGGSSSYGEYSGHGSHGDGSSWSEDGSGWDGSGYGASLYDVAKTINADDFWYSGVTGSGVDVAIIDTGVSPVDGLDGRGKVVNGVDVSFESQSDEFIYLDANGHGTHLAGIIGAYDRYDRSMRGIAYRSRIVNVKAGSFDGSVDVSQIIAAIDWVVQHKDSNGLNIRVLNLSYGTDSLQDPSIDPLSYAVEQAWKAGIVVVVAAGNDGPGVSLRNPAVNPYVISVGATDTKADQHIYNDVVADFSSCGTNRTVDVVAPGRSIESLRVPNSTADVAFPDARVKLGGWGSGYLFKGSGTSQATAVVSGAAALIVDQRPGITPDQVKAMLMATATPVKGSADCQGAGQVDLAQARYMRTPNAVQDYAPASGTGSLEAARGSQHVGDGVSQLTGEQDVRGTAWISQQWADAVAAGTSWSGGVWNGTSWSGGVWNGTSWSGGVWSGTSWSGTSWSAVVWSALEWLGSSWSGTSWSGTSWSGTSWSDSSWSGDGWLGLSWG